MPLSKNNLACPCNDAAGPVVVPRARSPTARLSGCSANRCRPSSSVVRSGVADEERVRVPAVGAPSRPSPRRVPWAPRQDRVHGTSALLQCLRRNVSLPVPGTRRCLGPCLRAAGPPRVCPSILDARAARRSADAERAAVGDVLDKGRRRAGAGLPRGPLVRAPSMQRAAGNPVVNALMAARLKWPGGEARSTSTAGWRSCARTSPRSTGSEKGLKAAKNPASRSTQRGHPPPVRARCDDDGVRAGPGGAEEAGPADEAGPREEPARHGCRQGREARGWALARPPPHRPSSAQAARGRARHPVRRAAGSGRR